MSAFGVKALLSTHGLRAQRDLGQNFLVDDTLAARLVDLAGVGPDDWVIEVGTGLGALTRALAARAARVVTIEIDAGLVRALRAEANLPDCVELVHGDAMKLDIAKLVAGAPASVRLVANLPYHVSAPLLRRLIDLRGLLADWSVMLQSEVANRLLAETGTRSYGSLAVLHRLVATRSRQMDLSPNCFFPVPKVDSTFVRLTPIAPPLVGDDELAWVERVVRAAFAKRRKTLVNSLRSGALNTGRSPIEWQRVMDRLGIDPRTRAERLEPEQLLALARELGQAA